MTYDFNPRPPRGGRLTTRAHCCAKALFQSTPPARGATQIVRESFQYFKRISIHAPREGGDDRAMRATAGESISIHAPREGGDGV